MQKTSKKYSETTNESTQHTYHNTSNLPEVVSVDVLNTMQDEDLIDHLRVMEGGLSKAESTGRSDPRAWQEEIAYIRREQQIRRTRRDAHAEITRKEIAEFDALEARLPAGDFDTTAFVYAERGGRAPRWN